MEVYCKRVQDFFFKVYKVGFFDSWSFCEIYMILFVFEVYFFVGDDILLDISNFVDNFDCVCCLMIDDVDY